MIRMKVFLLSTLPFDFFHQEKEMKNDQSEKGRAKYQKRLAQREEEYAPIEEFIAEIGFENVRSIITSTGSTSYLAYTIFYEDNNQGRR